MKTKLKDFPMLVIDGLLGANICQQELGRRSASPAILNKFKPQISREMRTDQAKHCQCMKLQGFVLIAAQQKFRTEPNGLAIFVKLVCLTTTKNCFLKFYK